MTKILRNLLALVALLGLVPSLASAQTQIQHTTFSTAVSATTNTVTLAAAAGSVKGGFLYSDGELFALLVNTSGTTWTVRRGLGEGFVPARAHSTTAIVWTAGGDAFKDYDVQGTCVQSTLLYIPHINRKQNRIYDCAGAGVWMLRDTDRESTQAAMLLCGGRLRCRDEFNNGYIVFKNDGTAKALTDGSVDDVIGSPLGAIEYRETGNKTISSWVTVGGQLDIRADKTDAAEGVEIVAGSTSDAALNALLTAGTNGGCVAAMVTIAKVANVTEFQVGWRQNQAFQSGAASYTSYTLFNSVGLTTTNGIITSSKPSATDVTGTATWADGERRALKVCVSSAGVPTAWYSGALADQEQPIYTPITMTTTGTTITATTGLIPFVSFVAVGTTDSGTKIDWIELSNTP